MEFLNYTVDLTLKDGTVSTGSIVSVDAEQITLNNTNTPISNKNIADLKVTRLPPDFVKSLKAKKKASKAVKDPRESKEPKEPKELNQLPDVKLNEEFDFQANLAMFDKKSVFEDFLKKDKVKPEDRLVGHNKVPTESKYKYNEMVLNGSSTDQWDSIGNANITKGTNVTGRSTPSQDIVHRSYSFVNGNNIGIPVCSPVQLRDVERLCSENMGITSGIFNETFASNLSTFITSNVLGGSSRLNSTNHNLPPLVLLLIGSERCSARALALGRHLANHGVRVLAYVVQSISNDDPELELQQRLFETCGGKTISTDLQQFFNLLDNQLNTPVELIIDALQGYDDHLEDIFLDEHWQQLLLLIKWCNNPTQLRKIMSLDIPSGVDGGLGSLGELGEFIHCKWTVSMGLPVVGILHGYKNNLFQDEIKHLLVDTGIPDQVYQRKASLRRFHKVWYTSEKIVSMKLVNE